jgi:hypothetical protein
MAFRLVEEMGSVQTDRKKGTLILKDGSLFEGY